MNGSLRVRPLLVGILAITLVVGGWLLRPKSQDSETDTSEASGQQDSDQDSSDLAFSDQAEGSETSSQPAGVDGAVAPLTGLPITGTDEEVDATSRRPAMFVKVDNHPQARPQVGLDLADIVFDVRAEGVTRFGAIYQSQVPDPVGPVRSSRTSDFDLVRGLDTPLYASSGGNDYVTAGLRQLPIIELTNRTRNEYYRDFARPAPHNLFVMGSELYALAPDDATPPDPWFTYRGTDDPLPEAAIAANGPVTIAYTGSPLVSHTWDPEVGGWLRTQDGRPHVSADGEQLAPENVVITITTYRTSPADAASPEVVSVGGGEVVVLTAGHIIEGQWQRPTAQDPLELTTDDGEPIDLTPGRTWVLMPEVGQVSFAR